MTNELVVTMEQLRNQLATIAGEVDEDTLAVAGNANSKRISIKGGVFRKIVGGKEIGKIEDRHMNVIFVKLAHTPSRTFYTEAFKEDAKVSPACWSTDAKVPDEAVKEKQAVSCDKCQWSVKGTGQNGQGTACRIAWRTAVVLPSDPGGDVMQLTIPAASAFGEENSGRYPFRAYIQMLAHNNVSAGRVITKMQFDTDAPSPRILFSPVGVVPAEDVPVVKQQATTPAAENAVKMTVYQREEAELVAAPVDPAVPPMVAAVLAAAAEPAAPAETVVPEPTLREASQATAAVAGQDISAVIAKWGSKKK